MGVIYKITSPSGKFYIGKSKNLKKRIKDYKYQYKKRKSIIHDSIKSYGWDNHTIEVIENCDDSILSEREIFWIKELNSYHLNNSKGMNMTLGGEVGGGSWMHDIERRKKQSESRSGVNGTFYGRHHTEENKKILSEKAYKRNIESGHRIPKWGAEKGRLKIIKSIIAYDTNGMFLSEFESAYKAANDLKINRSSITDSLRKKSWVNGKYLFRYKTVNYPLNIEVGEIVLKNDKRPVLTLDINFEVVCEHPSAQEASDFWGIPKTTINRAAMYNWLKPIRTGHVFIYTDLYAEIEALTA
jgi:group I intron endonuclease